MSLAELRSTVAELERVHRALDVPPAGDLIDRALDRLEGEILRKSEGNPYHDAEGHFTGPGGVGHAGAKTRRPRKKRPGRRPRKPGHTTGGKKGVDTRVKLTRSDAPKIKDHARAERAKATEKRSTGDVQRVGEANEATLIGKLGGTQGTDNGAVDVVRRMGGREHGIEVKTIVNKGGPNKSGARAQIKCEADQKARKEAWQSQKPGRELHTVVYDHRDRAADAAGTFIGNKEAYSGHDLYYRRGVGPFSLGGMQPVKSYAELKTLMAADVADLPAKARPPGKKSDSGNKGKS